MKLIAVGDNVTDCYLDEGIYYPGGNAVNVAVDCKRDGAEKVNYIGVFGNDDRADYIRACMEEEGVTCERSRKVFAPTCQPGVKINEEGDRIFVGGIRDTCQHLFSIRLQREDLEVIKEYDICHTSCYSNLEYELETLSRVCKVSFDFSDEHDDDYMKRVCPFVTYAFSLAPICLRKKSMRLLKRQQDMEQRSLASHVDQKVLYFMTEQSFTHREFAR